MGTDWKFVRVEVFLMTSYMLYVDFFCRRLLNILVLIILMALFGAYMGAHCSMTLLEPFLQWRVSGGGLSWPESHAREPGRKRRRCRWHRGRCRHSR